MCPTPLANSIVKKRGESGSTEIFPLDLFICEDCSHVQLLTIVDPAKLFTDFYPYISSTSEVMVKHLKNLADDVIKQYDLKQGDLVVEPGSNDGTLLKFFQDGGMKVIGVDPADNLVARANELGITSIHSFFDTKTATKIAKNNGLAKVICANNVFAHVDDIEEFTESVKKLLKPDGVFIFEVSYLLDIITNGHFDVIYHEHLDYHCVKSLSRYFSKHDMTLVNVERITTQGGSIRCFVKKGNAQPLKNVNALIKVENKAQLSNPNTFFNFHRRIKANGTRLLLLLQKLKSDGMKIAGYGAPAKATTLLYQFGITNEILDFIVDENPLKQGNYTPGSEIPIKAQSEIGKQKPDYVVILAWNFSAAIIEKNSKYLRKGGRFIVPFPNLEVVGSNSPSAAGDREHERQYSLDCIVHGL